VQRLGRRNAQQATTTRSHNVTMSMHPGALGTWGAMGTHSSPKLYYILCALGKVSQLSSEGLLSFSIAAHDKATHTQGQPNTTKQIKLTCSIALQMDDMMTQPLRHDPADPRPQVFELGHPSSRFEFPKTRRGNAGLRHTSWHRHARYKCSLQVSTTRLQASSHYNMLWTYARALSYIHRLMSVLA